VETLQREYSLLGSSFGEVHDSGHNNDLHPDGTTDLLEVDVVLVREFGRLLSPFVWHG